jgi:hypothetical protein
MQINFQFSFKLTYIQIKCIQIIIHTNKLTHILTNCNLPFIQISYKLPFIQIIQLIQISNSN